MSLPEPSNEQKLSFIYQTLKAQEARRKRHIYYRILRWMLYIALIYGAYTYHDLLATTVYKYVKDTINKEIRRVTEEQKAGILKGIQQLLPEVEKNNSDTSTKASTSTGKTSTGKTTTPATKTGTTTPKKK